jgi:hypothetical protein
MAIPLPSSQSICFRTDRCLSACRLWYRLEYMSASVVYREKYGVCTLIL